MSSLRSQLKHIILYCLFSLKSKYRKKEHIKFNESLLLKVTLFPFFFFFSFLSVGSSLYLCISLCSSITSFSQPFSFITKLPKNQSFFHCSFPQHCNMVRHSCCYKQRLRKGLWSPEEDEKLFTYITKHGHGCWSSIPKLAGKALYSPKKA